jgi:glycosyltransferase involved in cell wall biosynthesis
MKVIHLISGLRGGGAEQLILGLCRQSKLYENIEMKVALLSNINDIAPKFEANNIELVRPGTKKTKGFRAALSSINKVLREKPDTIHAHLYWASLAVAYIKIKSPKTKIVFTLHNNYQPNSIKRLSLALTKWLRNTDIIFPHTQPAWYQRKDAIAIGNGIDLSPYQLPAVEKEPNFTCLFIGRLTEQKNPRALINIAKSLSDIPNVQIKVYGEGPLQNELENQINQQGLKNIELKGYTHNIPEALLTAHCLLVTSHWEGMPLTIIEAAAAGLPIVATPAAVQCFPSLGGQINTAELKDFPKIIKAIANNYQQQLTKAAQNKAHITEEFSIEKCFNRHLEVWKP